MLRSVSIVINSESRQRLPVKVFQGRKIEKGVIYFHSE